MKFPGSLIAKASHLAIPLALILLSPACSTADLSFKQDGPSSANGQELLQKGKEILAEHRIQMGLDRLPRALQYSGLDRWNSWLVRQFTPVDNAEQRFAALVALSEVYIKIGFENESREIEETIELSPDGISTDSSLDRLYVGPTRDYLTWPLRLSAEHELQYVGAQELPDGRYHAFFATTAPDENEPGDQYRIYLDQENLEIRYIQFTLRALAESYTGWIHYSDYRELDGVKIPYRISIQDAGKPMPEDYIHRLEIDSVRRAP